MEEAIQQVLSNEAYTTDEERVDAIKKELAKLVIPKDKYNDLSVRLKNTESEKATLQAEYDEYKKSKMTDDEKIDVVAARILKEHRAAFEELAK